MSLKNYIQGKRKGKNANRLEREALNDPFLQDALEGFDTIPGNHWDAIEQLEKEIGKKNTRRKAIAFRRWQLVAAAACISLLLGIGSLFLLEGEFNGATPGIVQSDPLFTGDTIPETSKNISDTIIIIPAKDSIASPVPGQTNGNIPAPVTINKGATQVPAPVTQDIAQVTTEPPALPNTAQTDNVASEPDTLPNIEITGIGYGPMSREGITGAIGSIKEIPTSTAEQLLKGKIAGLEVVKGTGDPTKGATMRLRGGTSLSGDNSPLVVVDGIANVDMNTIQPEDIVSIDVLKDASAAAIYGSRGANGVILVTTTRGGKPAATYFGKKEFLKYVENNISEEICTGTEEAILRVNLYIDKNGIPAVTNIKESTCKELEDEFTRLLKDSPKWTLTDVKWNIKIKL